jgi:hypothetical protein
MAESTGGMTEILPTFVSLLLAHKFTDTQALCRGGHKLDRKMLELLKKY